jgi:hypothetical protein
MSRGEAAVGSVPKLRLVRVDAPKDLDLTMSLQIAARFALLTVRGGEAVHARRRIASRPPIPGAGRTRCRR